MLGVLSTLAISGQAEVIEHPTPIVVSLPEAPTRRLRGDWEIPTTVLLAYTTHWPRAVDVILDAAQSSSTLLMAWWEARPVDSSDACATTLTAVVDDPVDALHTRLVERYASALSFFELLDMRVRHRDAIAATALFRHRLATDPVPTRGVLEAAGVLLDEVRKLAKEMSRRLN
jgi:hypothetical protein